MKGRSVGGQQVYIMMDIALIAVIVALVGLAIAAYLYNKVNSIEIDNPTVADITQQIQDGAMAFLKAEYKYLAMFVGVVAVLLFFVTEDDGHLTSLAFLAGAITSVLAGFSGMRAAKSILVSKVFLSISFDLGNRPDLISLTALSRSSANIE